MMRPAMAAMGLSSQWWTRATTISLDTTEKPHEVDCNHAITAQPTINVRLLTIAGIALFWSGARLSASDPKRTSPGNASSSLVIPGPSIATVRPLIGAATRGSKRLLQTATRRCTSRSPKSEIVASFGGIAEPCPDLSLAQRGRSGALIILERIHEILSSTVRLTGAQAAINNADFDALLPMYTADARLIPPGAQPVTGAASHRAFIDAISSASGFAHTGATLLMTRSRTNDTSEMRLTFASHL
jgi:hypothetical protein